jgi:fibronectin type 3 domain-containing protein
MKTAPVSTSVVLLLTSLIVAGCGKPAPPIPPSLELPKPVADLHAFRKGDKVTLTWTVPNRTTEGQTIRYLGPSRICRGLVPDPQKCAKIAEVTPAQLGPEALERIKKSKRPKGKKQNRKSVTGDRVQARYEDVLSPDLQKQNATALATYSVETLNNGQRSAGLSNPVQVPLAPTLPPPTDVRATTSASGITITWSGIAPQTHDGINYVYRVYRSEQGSATETVAGEVPLSNSPMASFIDHGFEWNKTYEYYVTTVTTLPPPQSTEVEGDNSASFSLTATDVYPPSVPGGVQAVFSGVGQQPFIDLTWIPAPESDLAGYNIYRHEEGQALVKLNAQPVSAPAFRDTNVSPGKTYVYSITSVDARGNESAHSQETSESLP